MATLSNKESKMASSGNKAISAAVMWGGDVKFKFQYLLVTRWRWLGGWCTQHKCYHNFISSATSDKSRSRERTRLGANRVKPRTSVRINLGLGFREVLILDQGLTIDI